MMRSAANALSLLTHNSRRGRKTFRSACREGFQGQGRVSEIAEPQKVAKLAADAAVKRGTEQECRRQATATPDCWGPYREASASPQLTRRLNRHEYR
jgi:hypothetical protein